MSGRPGIIGVIPLALLTCISQVAAKQIFPKEPAPVVHDAVEYRAPHGNIGHVEAGDATTGTKLWEKKIYDQEVDPKLEVCNQLKVITAIKIQDGRLIVTRQGKASYSLNLKTRVVVDLAKERQAQGGEITTRQPPDAEVAVPNLIHAAVGAVTLLALATIVVVLIRRRKRRE